MEGQHEAQNAAIAFAVIVLLRDALRVGSAVDGPVIDGPENVGPAVDGPAGQSAHRLELAGPTIESAFSQLQCEARVEHLWLDHDVLAIVDASHNEDSINALCQCLHERSANRPVTVVFGTSIDKSADLMLGSLAGVAQRLILTRYHGNPRYQSPEQLARWVPASHRKEAMIVDDPVDACRQGLQMATPGGTLVICGSFFLAAETRTWILHQPRPSRPG
jgi:dihydrofolate synthase/folylpolyglutamate synthase